VLSLAVAGGVGVAGWQFAPSTRSAERVPGRAPSAAVAAASARSERPRPAAGLTTRQNGPFKGHLPGWSGAAAAPARRPTVLAPAISRSRRR